MLMYGTLYSQLNISAVHDIIFFLQRQGYIFYNKTELVYTACCDSLLKWPA